MPAKHDQWTNAELLQLLQDPALQSRKLRLKEGQTTVQRVWLGGHACIEKQYFGALLPNQQREADFIFMTSRLPQIAPHIAPLHSTQHRHSLAQQSFYTEWVGLDLEQWHSLLGAAHPLMNSVPGLLYLISKILHACFEFHDLGLVHNDLHWANIVLNFRYDAARHEVHLLPDQIRLIDFEFALRPRQAQPGIEARTTSEWLNEQGEAILLDPSQHSALVCAAEIEPALDSDKNLFRRYKRDADGGLIMKPEPFAALGEVDFGVDFFTLAHSIEHMIKLATAYWDDDQQIRQWDAAHEFLSKLPEQLRQYDALPADRAQLLRAAPHQAIMREIAHLIGRWRVPDWVVPLPAAQCGNAPTRRTLLRVAALGSAGTLLGAGTFWLTTREKPPIKPPAPAELNMRVRLQAAPGHKLKINPEQDNLRLDFSSDKRIAKLEDDGIARFDPIPGSQLGEKASVTLTSRWYEPSDESPTKKASIPLVNGLVDLPVRLKIKTLTGSVVEIVAEDQKMPLAQVKLTVADGSKDGQVAYTNADGLFSMALRSDLDGGEILIEAAGYHQKSQPFHFDSTPLKEQFRASDRLKSSR